jgi:hypothetical protein
MTEVALSILALMAGGLALELFGASPPIGAQDQRGLRFSAEPTGELEEFAAGNPS